MGDAPKIIEALRMTREEQREIERQWHLDSVSGEIMPEADPAEDPQARPQPIPAPLQKFD